MKRQTTPESVGLSSAELLKFYQELDEKVPTWQAMTVIKDGKTVVSAVKPPYDDKTPYVSHSVAKSFTSMAIGLLYTDGLIDLNDKVLKYQRDKLPEKYDPRLEDLTVRDVLRFNSSQVTFSSYFVGITSDWVTRYFSFDLPRDPGTGFQYDTGGSLLLCSLVNVIAGRSAFDLVNERIFRPLGIYNAQWLMSPQGVSAGGWGLYLSMEDYCKIAQFWLNMGEWEGKQLISREYMLEATKTQTPTGAMGAAFGMEGYGYQFWIKENTFNAVGSYGVMIHCCPEKNMAAVVFANDNATIPVSGNVTIKYLFAPDHPAKLEEDPEALAKLDAFTESVHMPYAPGNAAGEAVEKAIFGRYIPLKENVRDIKGISFERTSEDEIVMNLTFSDRNVPVSAKYHGFITNVTPRLGIRTSFPDEAFVHTYHGMTYGITDDMLTIYDSITHHNNQDVYIFNVKDGKLSGTVQVSTIIGGETAPEPLEEK